MNRFVFKKSKNAERKPHSIPTTVLNVATVPNKKEEKPEAKKTPKKKVEEAPAENNEVKNEE